MSNNSPHRLIIADGTRWRCVVYDYRYVYHWADPSHARMSGPTRLVILHHTATEFTGGNKYEKLAHAKAIADNAPYKLPYNFVIWPDGIIWYVNNVDYPWPHTLNYNGHTAVALIGNYQDRQPPRRMLFAYRRLFHALKSMWEGAFTLRAITHRELGPTACPGDGTINALVPFVQKYWEDYPL